MTTTEQCWDGGCYKPAKYHETTTASERPDGQEDRVYSSVAKTVTRERGYCGIHAPSRIAARMQAKRDADTKQRIAKLRFDAARTELVTNRFLNVVSGEVDSNGFVSITVGREFTADGLAEAEALRDDLSTAHKAAQLAVTILRARRDLAAIEQPEGGEV